MRLPLNKIGALNKINKTFSQLEQEHEREPSPDEVANILELPEDKVASTLELSGRHLSVDAPFQDGEENSLLDVLQNFDTPSTDSKLIDESLTMEIERTLNTLPEKESRVIRSFYGIGRKQMSLEEIGEEIGISRERTRQIKEKAIKHLRQRTKNKLLRTYLG